VTATAPRPPAPEATGGVADLRERLMAALPREPERRSLRWLLRGLVLWPVLVGLACALWPAVSWAAPAGINVNLQDGSGGVSTTLQLLALLTVLSLAPSIVIMMTSFTRIVIVLGFVRNALGTPQLPPNQVLVGIALFLTMFVMGPTLTQINDTAIQPLMADRISETTALERAEAPVRNFMFDQMSDDSTEIALFMDMAGEEAPKTRADVPTRVLIPSFVLSELKKAFEIGFLIFVPFLIIDIVIASTVMSMGMVMLPPTVISLPFKILLFVLVDGWSLVAESLVRGFNMG
jgi:flagellar biosynthetic protein FliP